MAPSPQVTLVLAEERDTGTQSTLLGALHHPFAGGHAHGPRKAGSMTAFQERQPGPANGERTAGVSGLVFVVLLLVGAGMATVPGADDTTAAVRTFYRQHTGIVVVAQVIELVGAVPLVMFVLGLARSRLVVGSRRLSVAGLTMVGAAVLTAIPPLWLCVVASTASAGLIDTLALLSDLVDVLLFLTIAWFAATCARQWLGSRWLSWAALGAAGLCALRAVEIVFRGSILTVAGPVAFLLLVVALSVCLLRTSQVRRQRPSPAR